MEDFSLIPPVAGWVLVKESAGHGLGNLRPRRVWADPSGRWVVVSRVTDENKVYAVREVQGYQFSEALSLNVVPETKVVGDWLMRDWIFGGTEATLVHVFSLFGLRVAIFDFLTFMRDRVLNCNVVVDEHDRVWAVDHENAFADSDAWGGSFFLDLWETKRPPQVEGLMHDEISRVQRYGSAWLSTLLTSTIGVEKSVATAAIRRYAILCDTQDVGQAWKVWRGEYGHPLPSLLRAD